LVHRLPHPQKPHICRPNAATVREWSSFGCGNEGICL
jgi:hypothetical protein